MFNFGTFYNFEFEFLRVVVSMEPNEFLTEVIGTLNRTQGNFREQMLGTHELKFLTYCKYTANILVAKIATISCVHCPVAIWLQFLQLSAEANISC